MKLDSPSQILNSNHIGISDVVQMFVACCLPKGNESQCLVIPFEFTVYMRLYDDNAQLASDNESVFADFKERKNCHVEMDEDYVEAVVRVENKIFLYAPSNYIHVWSTIDTNSIDKALYDESGSVLAWHLANHDSQWRSGVEKFEKMVKQSLAEPFTKLVSKLKVLGLTEPDFSIAFSSNPISGATKVETVSIDYDESAKKYVYSRQ